MECKTSFVSYGYAGGNNSWKMQVINVTDGVSIMQ